MKKRYIPRICWFIYIDDISTGVNLHTQPLTPPLLRPSRPLPPSLFFLPPNSLLFPPPPQPFRVEGGFILCSPDTKIDKLCGVSVLRLKKEKTYYYYYFFEDECLVFKVIYIFVPKIYIFFFSSF